MTIARQQPRRLPVTETTCDLILSCPRYKHLASSRLAHDQRQPETNECSARDVGGLSERDVD